jgi:hypothetical protein
MTPDTDTQKVNAISFKTFTFFLLKRPSLVSSREI